MTHQPRGASCGSHGRIDIVGMFEGRHCPGLQDRRPRHTESRFGCGPAYIYPYVADLAAHLKTLDLSG